LNSHENTRSKGATNIWNDVNRLRSAFSFGVWCEIESWEDR